MESSVLTHIYAAELLLSGVHQVSVPISHFTNNPISGNSANQSKFRTQSVKKPMFKRKS